MAYSPKNRHNTTREHDPLKRKQLLEDSIAQGEEPENNEIRKKIWEIRYKDKAETGGDARADGFLAHLDDSGI